MKSSYCPLSRGPGKRTLFAAAGHDTPYDLPDARSCTRRARECPAEAPRAGCLDQPEESSPMSDEYGGTDDGSMTATLRT